MSTQTPPLRCPSCGTQVQPGVRFCGNCGAAVPQPRACRTCGTLLAENDRFCQACGTPVMQPAPTAPAPPAPLAAPPAFAARPAAPPPTQRSRTPMLVGVGVLAVVCICAAVAAGVFGFRWLRDRGGAGGVPWIPTQVASRAGAVKVGYTGGTVTMPGGPVIEIPDGAVDSSTAGGAQEIAVTVARSTRTVSLPGGWSVVGDVYEIEPSGVSFAVPVRVTLPIPAGIDAADVLGLVTLDEASGQWVSISSTVDAVARTVSAFTTHFSPWGIVGGRSAAAQSGGWVKVVNTYARGSANFPGCKNKPLTLENGVCFLAYTPNDPNLLLRPWRNQLIARDQTTIEYWLPAGTYTLEPFKFASEINSDPMYSPCVDFWTRPAQTLVIQPGTTAVFGDDSTFPPAEDYAHIPNQCADTSRVKPTPSAEGTATPAAGATETPAAAVEEIFAVTSIGGAYNGASSPTVFTIAEPWLVTELKTYHWNEAQGATPGTIALQAADGTVYGPWQASGEPGQGGVPNAYWVVHPDIVIPAGTYTVLDSDPSTWAQNSDTGGAGMAWGAGIRQGGG